MLGGEVRFRFWSSRRFPGMRSRANDRPRMTNDSPGSPQAPFRLTRAVGLPGAVLMGLGSILGTGIFVSLGLGAGVAGPAVVGAIAVAAVVAVFNGLSSAQLAASHPVSGGTYEYGYRYLNPALGFTAGWMFLSAKSASAATAALGLAGYLWPWGGGWMRVAMALTVVGVLTVVVAGGMERSNRANAAIVTVTLLALGAFVVAGMPAAIRGGGAGHWEGWANAGGAGLGGWLEATALMFVAYTGYGRIATLGEEIRDPRRGIPRAIGITLLVTLALYVAVAWVAVGAAGAPAVAVAARETAAPLRLLAEGFGVTGLGTLVAVGAVTAMLGVLLNLLLGLSRVALAMARRRDLPGTLARLDRVDAVDGARVSPRRAVFAVGGVVALLALTGSVRATWSFSAFTVLVYYALTNLAALRLTGRERRYPRWVAVAGLGSCLGLAFRVEPAVWLAGLGWIAVGLAGRACARRRQSSSTTNASGGSSSSAS